MPNDRKLSSNHFFEVRLEPQGAFLNRRGEIADFIKERELFRHWNIGSNKVDFWNSEDRSEDPETASVSFRSVSYQMLNPSTQNHFSDRTAKFLTALEEAPGFKFTPVERLGVRAHFYLQVEGLTFSELHQKFAEKACGKPFKEIFDEVWTDVGVILELRKGETFLRIHTGPMKKDQFVKQFSPLSEKDSIGEVGFFLDIDCFRVDLKTTSSRDIIGTMKTLHKTCWEKLDKLANFLEISQ